MAAAGGVGVIATLLNKFGKAAIPIIRELGKYAHKVGVGTLLANHTPKLQKILYARGSQFGFSGNLAKREFQQFASMIEHYAANASKVWLGTYQGQPALFHINGNVTVLTRVDGTFWSVWGNTTAAQLNFYRGRAKRYSVALFGMWHSAHTVARGRRIMFLPRQGLNLTVRRRLSF
jgi:hypothetical protein